MTILLNQAYRTCTGSSQCLWYSKWCNGNEECVNGADETDCSESSDTNESSQDNSGDEGTSESDLEAMCGNNLCTISTLNVYR